ncbi:MAG: hypothetical protein FJY76_00340 [Candidatus Aenigmarchaeota archaeon]|nr:hypothetical protein [Candidatus Aenigmarchaeota archaeon]
MGKDWLGVSEDERARYLNAGATELQRAYGVVLDEAKVLLCSQWGWDPKKYVKADDARAEPAGAGSAASAHEAGSDK